MSKMNTLQRNYMTAKAIVEQLNAAEERIERTYISTHSIVNPGGSVPSRIYCIDDEDAFNAANDATAKEIDALGFDNARKALHDAEDVLIRFGLSLAPSHERQVLTDRCFGLNGHYVHVDIRQKVIDLTFKLDVSTIPA